MAASMGVLDVWTVALSFVNKPRTGERRSLRNDNCGLAGAAALAARERRNQACFLNFELFRGAVPGSFFHRSFCVFCFAEERRTFVDMWTSLDTFSFRAACAQKCL